jgi:hypothetical protein
MSPTNKLKSKSGFDIRPVVIKGNVRVETRGNRRASFPERSDLCICVSVILLLKVYLCVCDTVLLVLSV